MKRGILTIKNVSGAAYQIAELGGHEIEDNEEIDLLDDELPSFYSDWSDANRLVTETTTAQLYQDIQSGDIEVVTNTPPLPR